jgi:hypothetical protein
MAAVAAIGFVEAAADAALATVELLAYPVIHSKSLLVSGEFLAG